MRKPKTIFICIIHFLIFSTLLNFITLTFNKTLIANATPLSTNSYDSLEELVHEYLGDDIEKFGLIYYDLTTGKKLFINENKEFTAASTYKLGMNMIAYSDVRDGKLSLNKGITYIHGSDYSGGTGILQGQINSTLKKSVPLQTLLDLSITHSDNIATGMVSRTLGGYNLTRQRINKRVNLSCTTSENKTTPLIQLELLKELYNSRDDKHHSHLINEMKNTVFHDRIDKYIPQDIVAHKIGNYGGAVNDIGIVFSEKPFILVFYTDRVNDAEEKIATLSKIFYENNI